MPLANGEMFAGYRILRTLGLGGMGEVYLAEHPRLPRHDALKILPAEMSADHEFRERFNREAELAATLYHPHIVGVHDRGEFNGQLWISMDYIDGPDAGRLQREYYPAGMPPSEVVDILTAVADALDYAHDRGLLHRDVKPPNILLTTPARGRRRVLLADFGIARNAGEVSGLTDTNLTVRTRDNGGVRAVGVVVVLALARRVALRWRRRVPAWPAPGFGGSSALAGYHRACRGGTGSRPVTPQFLQRALWHIDASCGMIRSWMPHWCWVGKVGW